VAKDKAKRAPLTSDAVAQVETGGYTV